MILNKKKFLLLFLTILLSCTTTHEKHYDEELENYINNRFSFKVLLPKNFKKTFSQNEDGVTLTHPQNKNVEIRAWASHNALFHNLEQEAQFRLEGKKLISQKNITLQKIKGKRVESEEGGQKILEVFALHKDIFYSLRFEAPKNDFKTYEKIFENITTSLIILK